MKKIILLSFFVFASLCVMANTISGDWYGNLNVMGQQLPLVFHIGSEEAGYKTTLDSPKQGVKGIPVGLVIVTSDSILDLKMDALRASFHGVLKSNDKIEGTFTQGMSFPMNLSREKQEVVKIKRPQDPAKPYPYKSEGVTFSHDGITLAGTLTLPSEGCNFPAVVLVSGSGQQNRDEELMNHRPFLVLSDYLTRNGIAVLRYDDRGIGGSNGLSAENTFIDFAKDAACAIKYLKGRKDVNPSKVGILGHSEGGLIGFIEGANPVSAPAFVVSLAGPAVKGADLMVKQNELTAKTEGVTMGAKEHENLVRIFKALATKNNSDSLRKELTALMIDTYKILGKNVGDEEMGEINQSINAMLQSGYHAFVAYDPTAVIRRIKCPVMAINGGMDSQVDAEQNLGAIEAIKRSTGHKNLTTKLYPNVNHLFQTVNHLCSVVEYGNIEETMSPEVLSDIAKWILSVTK